MWPCQAAHIPLGSPRKQEELPAAPSFAIMGSQILKTFGKMALLCSPFPATLHGKRSTQPLVGSASLAPGSWEKCLQSVVNVCTALETTSWKYGKRVYSSGHINKVRVLGCDSLDLIKPELYLSTGPSQKLFLQEKSRHSIFRSGKKASLQETVGVGILQPPVTLMGEYGIVPAPNRVPFPGSSSELGFTSNSMRGISGKVSHCSSSPVVWVPVLVLRRTGGAGGKSLTCAKPASPPGLWGARKGIITGIKPHPPLPGMAPTATGVLGQLVPFLEGLDSLSGRTCSIFYGLWYRSSVLQVPLAVTSHCRTL